jgi:hypothetical protein
MLRFLVFVAALLSAESHNSKLCTYVYVDMGTNIGHQIRKLYEPHLYPGNPTEQHFQAVFGDSRRNVCAFGFEANPVHTTRLRSLQHAYRLMGRDVTIFTETPVSNVDGPATFYFNHDEVVHNEWRAGLTFRDNAESTTLQTLDIAAWMKKNTAGVTRMMMKTDIEGTDELVLTHLFSAGVLCDIDLVYGEHMSDTFFSNMTRVLKDHDCKTKLISLDDETGDDSLPLPTTTL